MTDASMPTFSAGSGQKILLIGDVGKAFLDPDSITEQRCEVHADMVDGIDAAAKNSFAVIGVVMPPLPRGSLSSALQSLRRANAGAKIILLAQMYQEPIARKLVNLDPRSSILDSRPPAGLADDYLICPVALASIEHRTSGIRRQASNTLERKIKELEKLATEDDLTGLKNRRYIWEFARQILEHARDESGRVTLLIFDIDNFKHYNDVYGHTVGDNILKQAAVLMRRCCRAHDVVGRIGGDEFAVIFWDDQPVRSKAGKLDSDLVGTKFGTYPEPSRVIPARRDRRLATVEPPKEAIFIANRFRKEFERAELHLLGPNGEGVLTISGGLASFPRDGPTAQQLFLRADKALLEAKRSGKNRIYLVGKPQSDIAGIE
jgi:GGDEF domain-containing protein